MSDELQSSPHDALFRHAFTQLENAAGLLRALLPAELVEEVQWDTLQLREGSYVDAALRERESDLVFSAKAGARAVLFYVLVEHQSSSDPWMVWRLWRYVTGVWERWMRDHPNARKLPRVIPVVVFHGASPWSAARSIAARIEPEPALGPEHADLVPRFTYILDDLGARTPEELRDRALPAFAALVLWALRSAPRRTFAATVSVFGDLFDALGQSADGAEALGAILRYLSIVTGDDEGAVVAAVLGQLSPPVQERAMSYYDRLLREGETKGRAEGIAVGALEGRRSIVQKQLALKFGPLGEGVLARLEASTLEELDAMAERILTATSVDQVLGSPVRP